MKNPDNKTNMLNEIKLTNYITLIESNPCHIATVNNDNTPNLSVASDIKVLDNETILISNNEMIHTPDNIIANPVDALVKSGFFVYDDEKKVFSIRTEIWHSIDPKCKRTLAMICEEKLKSYFRE